MTRLAFDTSMSMVIHARGLLTSSSSPYKTYSKFHKEAGKHREGHRYYRSQRLEKFWVQSCAGEQIVDAAYPTWWRLKQEAQLLCVPVGKAEVLCNVHEALSDRSITGFLCQVAISRAGLSLHPSTRVCNVMQGVEGARTTDMLALCPNHLLMAVQSTSELTPDRPAKCNSQVCQTRNELRRCLAHLGLKQKECKEGFEGRIPAAGWPY